ncbi:MAG: T9SS type A sorting domain-containing protein [Bacteroidales bacterium]|nr:T9SS type A sorting domain-containing protein [Bacteroidales bacterium]
MKHLFFKTLAIGLILLAMPLKQYGQSVKNHSIELEVESIVNPDYRYCLLSAIANDSNLNYTVNEDYMSVLISSSENLPDNQFQSYFNGIKEKTETEFNAYLYKDKEKQGEMFSTWKERLPQDLFVLLFKQMLIENPTNRDGNQTCATSEPFCTIDGITFHVDANPSGSCEPGPNYDCLSRYTARRPYWFHMKIAVAGNFRIQMTNSANVDIDYCCWGPFDDPVSPCPNQLQNIVDCGSTSATTEYCNIPSSAQVGKYYIMVITKWNQSTPTDITFQKVPNSGPGETDCGILPGVASNDGPYCVGDAIHLNVNAQEGATYSWSGPGGYTSNQQNPTRPNCTMAMAGVYTCVTTVGTHSVTATTTVQISPKPTANFTATSVCLGNSTHFTNTSTTNPANQSMSYQWNFGDGQTSTQQSPTHQYTTADNFTVTLTVSCGSSCTSTKTQTVSVYANPVANAGEDQTVIYNGTAQLHGSAGTPGTFNYHWEPANKVENPDSQNTQTVALHESTTFTLTVTHPTGGCTSTDQVSVLVEGSNMTATASASPNSVCMGESSQLNAIAVGGTQNYTYSWTPTLGLSDPLIANPMATPTATTTYTCHVSDGLSSQDVQTTVTVNQPEYEDIEQWICLGESYTFYGEDYSEEGTYPYYTTTAQGCEKVITLHLHHYEEYPNAHTTTEYICPGEGFIFHGHYYNTTGTYSENLQTVHGCDSIVWLNLTVYPANDTIIVDPTICTSQTYNFHGVEYNQDGDVAYFDTIDSHGCLLVEKLELSVGPYQMPPKEEPRICVPYDETPYFYWDKTGLTYTQDTQDEIILPDPQGGCDIKYRLNLKFHQEFYQSDTVTVCDAYQWPVVPGSNYTSTDHHIVKTFPGTGGTGFDCDSTYVLNLTVNKSNNSEVTILNQCDQYVWNFGWNDEAYTLTEPGDYPKVIPTYQGCDSTVVMHLQLDYTPDFERVEGNPWVVGGSEFQYTIERYWIETHPQSTHETEWGLYYPNGEPFNKWDLVPYDNGDKCQLYIYTFERDSIELRAHTRSSGLCECGEFTHSKWIHCGYFDISENTSLCEADIFPNPNDGTMTLSFDNMMGYVDVKVYNITGTLVDQFNLFNGYGHQTHEYQSSHLSNGVYFFQFSSNEGKLTKKVVIFD